MRNLSSFAFQSIFDHAPAALVMCEREGRIAYANRAFSTLVGSPASVVGTLLEDSLHESDAAGCEDVRHILAASEVAHGTTFTIHLPAVSEAPQSIRHLARPRPSLEGSETILVVEDDPTVRGLASDILSDHGYDVLVAKHSRNALEVGTSHAGKIDLLLTDIVMPGMNGRDLAKSFQDSRPTTRVMFMTGYAQDDLVRSAQLESNQLLEKPFAPSGLLRKVREVLDQS